MAAVPSQQQQPQQPENPAVNPWTNGPAGHATGPPQGHIGGNSSASGPLPPRPPGMVSPAPQSFVPPMPMQFRPPQTNQQFMPQSGQQFRPVGQGVPPPNMGSAPVQPQPMQYAPQMQHMQGIPSQQQQAPPSSQPSSIPYMQQPRPMNSGPMTGGPLPPQQPQHQSSQPLNMAPPTALGGMPMQSSSYTFTSPGQYAQPMNTYSVNSQFQPVVQPQQMSASHVAPQHWGTSAQSSVQTSQSAQPGQQPAAAFVSTPGATVSTVNSNTQNSSDWQEHTSADGRRYYYNKKTRQSSWEKPFELMTPIERADASTVWKEFTTADGRKYYYNKVTKQSKWTIPDELKIAREQAEKAMASAGSTEGTVQMSASPIPVATSSSPSKTPPNLSAINTSTVTTANASVAVPPATSLLSSNSTAVSSFGPTSISAVGASPSVASSVPAVASASNAIPTNTTAVTASASEANALAVSSSDKANGRDSTETKVDDTSAQDLEEAKKTMPVAGKINVTPVSTEKANDEEPPTYATKTEAKNAFKELLESVHVESDWTWDQAMRIIVNDKRYGALKTLGERKQAFNEYLAQRKKHEAEERRIRQKKAREDFVKMLEECKELTSSMRWSKAVPLFEDDPRFQAVDRSRDREELFEGYLTELERKERERAREERKQNLAEYRAFLESCDFIKVNTQWRKVQDRLEDDERCSRLDKLDRLEVFQEYIRDLEREEEEEKRIQKEQLRRRERKNRDEFRKLLAEHKDSGMLTAKTNWRDYCAKVKDHPAYVAVASNTSGSTPKDLFEDIVEDLDKQYHEDKGRIKDAIKSGKFQVSSAWTFEMFKDAIAEFNDVGAMSEANIKLVFDEILERIREKEEKEAKKRQKLADEFTELLYSIKEITATSRWEDSKPMLEDLPEYRAISDEIFRREIFEEYVGHLQEKAKEKERKREEEKAKKEKEKEEKEKEREKRKEKEREREKEKDKRDKERDREKAKERSKRDRDSASDSIDAANHHAQKEERKKEREKEKDRKHRKRHSSAVDDVSSEREDKEESKRSRRHTSDRKKSSRKHTYDSGSESEGRHKRHKRDRDSTRRNGALEELEDGEVGEDGA
eukprot:TRINITY_DN22986_c0_g2_i2.p1 TRINITY_DN22986_c0_g2~~TRINITY_DN22986_c0_g2_i2.p1  ORF type:complete len:1096 (-),score=355.45 TRINITY_DN22986_c0_g2_i2:190-3477(-)